MYNKQFLFSFLLPTILIELIHWISRDTTRFFLLLYNSVFKTFSLITNIEVFHTFQRLSKMALDVSSMSYINLESSNSLNYFKLSCVLVLNPIFQSENPANKMKETWAHHFNSHEVGPSYAYNWLNFNQIMESILHVNDKNIKEKGHSERIKCSSYKQDSWPNLPKIWLSVPRLTNYKMFTSLRPLCWRLIK